MEQLHPALTVRLYTDRKRFRPGVTMRRRVESLRSLRAAAMDMRGGIEGAAARLFPKHFQAFLSPEAF